MRHSPARVVRKLLVDLGLASDPPPPGKPFAPWPASAGGELANPDDVITVTRTAGKTSGSDMPTGELWEHYGVQIRVRARDEKLGETKADEILDTLTRTVFNTHVTLNNYIGGGTTTYTVQCVRASSGVLPLGKETPQSQRNLWTMNMLATIEQQ